MSEQYDELPAWLAEPEPPKQWGAYWLHPDGWYRLFPPAETNNDAALKTLEK